MTIFALSTGPGISGIAVIRVSGKNTSEVIKRFPELPKIMDKANEVISLIADGKLHPNTLAFHSLKEEELKMQIIRNKVLAGVLILVIFVMIVFK